MINKLSISIDDLFYVLSAMLQFLFYSNYLLTSTSDRNLRYGNRNSETYEHKTVLTWKQLFLIGIM